MYHTGNTEMESATKALGKEAGIKTNTLVRL